MTKMPWGKWISLLPSILNGLDEVGKLKVPSQKTTPAPQITISNEATPYWIEESTGKIYLCDKHPEVVAICLMAWEFAQLINNRDYKSLDGSVEYHLYSKEYRNQLFLRKGPQTTTKHCIKHKVKSYCNNVNIVSVYFDKYLNQAEVVYGVEIVITEAKDKYFKILNKQIQGKPLDKNIPYRQFYTLKFIKEEGQWKINSFKPNKEITLLTD
jgi:hypothetical protein